MKSGPFNFYQQISGLYFGTGDATPFALFTNYTDGGVYYLYGVYYPQQVFFGDPLYLSNDGDSNPTRFSIKQSGKVDKVSPDKVPFVIVPSGNIYPSQPDYETYSIQPSGNITGFAPDKVNFLIPVSGSITGIPLDITTFSNIISGNITGCPLDLVPYNVIVYGNLTGYSLELVGFNSNTHGNIRGIQKDKNTISFNLDSIMFARGINQISYSGRDDQNLTFTINTISFKKST
jgi:hypothetical protein